jgi:hypothetical protein
MPVGWSDPRDQLGIVDDPFIGPRWKACAARSFVIMYAVMFEIRWARKCEFEAHGHVELEDFIGAPGDLGPLVRCGLLSRRPVKRDQFQRYWGYEPKGEGLRLFLHDPIHHLIMVRAEHLKELRDRLAKDPAPGAPFHPSFQPLDLLDPLAVRMEQPPVYLAGHKGSDPLTSGGRDTALMTWQARGHLEYEAFRRTFKLHDDALIASGLCRTHRAGRDGHRVALVPTTIGGAYFTLDAANDLLLVDPGMELPLLDLLDPTRAAYWTAQLPNRRAMAA